MTQRTAVKNLNGSGYLIDDGSGYSIRYASKADALRQIARIEKMEAEAVVIRAEQRASRLAAARDYLATRAARAEANALQVAFAF